MVVAIVETALEIVAELVFGAAGKLFRLLASDQRSEQAALSD